MHPLLNKSIIAFSFDPKSLSGSVDVCVFVLMGVHSSASLNPVVHVSQCQPTSQEPRSGLIYSYISPNFLFSHYLSLKQPLRLGYTRGVKVCPVSMSQLVPAGVLLHWGPFKSNLLQAEFKFQEFHYIIVDVLLLICAGLLNVLISAEVWACVLQCHQPIIVVMMSVMNSYIIYGSDSKHLHRSEWP